MKKVTSVFAAILFLAAGARAQDASIPSGGQEARDAVAAHERSKSKLEADEFETAIEEVTEATRLMRLALSHVVAGTYTVRLIPERRDCLWRIAEYKQIYADPYQWPKIWKANTDKIEDPDLIYPGQVLKIPK